MGENKEEGKKFLGYVAAGLALFIVLRNFVGRTTFPSSTNESSKVSVSMRNESIMDVDSPRGGAKMNSQDIELEKNRSSPERKIPKTNKGWVGLVRATLQDALNTVRAGMYALGLSKPGKMTQLFAGRRSESVDTEKDVVKKYEKERSVVPPGTLLEIEYSRVNQRPPTR